MPVAAKIYYTMFELFGHEVRVQIVEAKRKEAIKMIISLYWASFFFSSFGALESGPKGAVEAETPVESATVGLSS